MMFRQPGPVKLRLLALPCAGGSATMYLRWRRNLPDWVELHPVELPGRGSRLGEACIEDFDALVEQLCSELHERMQGGYALFGHSMGALLAYGMARHQCRRGAVPPRALFVSACAAPSRRDPKRFADRHDDEALMADLREQGGTPEAVLAHPELLRMTLDVLGADYRVCESFCAVPDTPLPIPLHALAGWRDAISPDCIAAWRQAGSSRFSLDWFEGGHFFIRDQEQAVLQTLTRRLAPHAPLHHAPITETCP